MTYMKLFLCCLLLVLPGINARSQVVSASVKFPIKVDSFALFRQFFPDNTREVCNTGFRKHDTSGLDSAWVKRFVLPAIHSDQSEYKNVFEFNTSDGPTIFVADVQQTIREDTAGIFMGCKISISPVCRFASDSFEFFVTSMESACYEFGSNSFIVLQYNLQHQPVKAIFSPEAFFYFAGFSMVKTCITNTGIQSVCIFHDLYMSESFESAAIENIPYKQNLPMGFYTYRHDFQGQTTSISDSLRGGIYKDTNSNEYLFVMYQHAKKKVYYRNSKGAQLPLAILTDNGSKLVVQFPSGGDKYQLEFEKKGYNILSVNLLHSGKTGTQRQLFLGEPLHNQEIIEAYLNTAWKLNAEP